MKHLFYLLLLFIAYLPVHGQEREKILNIGLDLRIDYDNIMNTIQPDMSRIILHTSNIAFYGEVYPGITYKFEQKINSSAALTSDQYTSRTTDAWINFAPRNWRWSFTAGKQDIMFGSFESDYDPSDMYLISMVFDNFNRSQVGVAAHYGYRNYVFSGQVSNVSGDQLGYDPNHAFAYTLNSYGSYFKNHFLSSLSYTLIQAGNGKLFHWVSFGSQIRAGNFFTETDAYVGRYRQNMSIDASQSNYREADNISVSIREFYSFGKYRPFLKVGINWQRDVETNRQSQRSIGASGGLEFYPIKGEDFRLHIVYTYQRERYGNMWFDRDGIEIINSITAGLKWNIPLGSLFTKVKKPLNY